MLVIAATPQVETIIPGISRPVIAGGLLLAGMGLLHLGITAEILRITLGLLTVMAGFELLYATVETSILLAGLLSIVNLGLALAGAYLMTAASVGGDGMNAPILWIFLPFALGGFLLLFRHERVLTILGGTIALFLSLLAILIPIDTVMLSGIFSFKLAGSLNVLGRSFVLETADGPLLAILYGLAAMWFFGAETLGLARRLIPAGTGDPVPAGGSHRGPPLPVRGCLHRDRGPVICADASPALPKTRARHPAICDLSDTGSAVHPVRGLVTDRRGNQPR